MISNYLTQYFKKFFLRTEIEFSAGRQLNMSKYPQPLMISCLKFS